MNRTIRGMAGLIVVLGASACANDWSLDFEGPPTQIQASPDVMFINQGATKQVFFRLVNDVNQSVPAAFEISNVGAGISVEKDTTYRPDWVHGDTLSQPELLNQQRYVVSASAPVGTTFTVSSGGISKEIRVNVIPASIPVTVTGGNGTTDPSQISSENFVFDANTSFKLNGYTLPYLGASADGHTANVIVPAGFTNATLTIAGAKAAYIPTVGLPALDASDPVSGPTASTPLAGTADPNTAPTITLPESGPGGIGDTGTPFVYVDDLYEGSGSTVKFFKLVVPTDRSGVTISLDWTPGEQNADLDLFVTDLDFNDMGNAANGNGSGVPPEVVTTDLPAGTYLIGVVNWVNRTPPPFILISIK